ncbi:hypothetical protein ACOMHN_002228 [Nucella lapillus]
MSAFVRHAILLLFTSFYVIPDLFSSPSHQAQATSLELKLSSDVTDDDIRLEEEEVKAVHFNYTLNVTGDANYTLALAVCVTVDDPSVASASVSNDTIVPLHTDNRRAFQVSVRGHFVGRAYLHMLFVVGENKHVRCGQPRAKNLQDMLRVSQASQGQERDMNLTKTSSANSSSSVVGLHSGMRYKIAVLRPERAIDVVFRTCIIILVVIINVGMGCKLDIAVVKATLRRPFAPIIGLCSQFIVMPLVSFGLTQLFDLTPGVALGFFALGCSPGGSASNLFCYLLGGDVSLSITMTFISTVASIGLLPMWMSTLGRYVANMDDISIPYANIVYSLLGLVAAVGAGLILKVKKPAWARVAIKVMKGTTVVFLIFMLTVGIYANLYVFSLMRGEVLAAAAVLPYGGFILGGLVALVFRMPAKYVVTIAIETGIQNTGVAMIVLLLSLDQPESDLSIVAPATSALFTPLPLWIAVIVFKVRRCYKRIKEAKDTTTSTPEGDSTTKTPENHTNPSPSENLCQKLFGPKNFGFVRCWRDSCFYCCSEIEKERAQAPRDLEIVVPDPKTSPAESSASPAPGKKESYEFDNAAFEKGVSEHPKNEDCDGSGAEEEGEAEGYGQDSASDSPPDGASLRENGTAHTVC